MREMTSDSCIYFELVQDKSLSCWTLCSSSFWYTYIVASFISIRASSPCHPWPWLDQTKLLTLCRLLQSEGSQPQLWRRRQKERRQGCRWRRRLSMPSCRQTRRVERHDLCHHHSAFNNRNLSYKPIPAVVVDNDEVEGSFHRCDDTISPKIDPWSSVMKTITKRTTTTSTLPLQTCVGSMFAQIPMNASVSFILGQKYAQSHVWAPDERADQLHVHIPQGFQEWNASSAVDDFNPRKR